MKLRPQVWSTLSSGRGRRLFPHRSRLVRVTELSAVHKRNKKSSQCLNRHLSGSEALGKGFVFLKKEKDTHFTDNSVS